MIFLLFIFYPLFPQNNSQRVYLSLGSCPLNMGSDVVNVEPVIFMLDDVGAYWLDALSILSRQLSTKSSCLEFTIHSCHFRIVGGPHCWSSYLTFSFNVEGESASIRTNQLKGLPYNVSIQKKRKGLLL